MDEKPQDASDGLQTAPGHRMHANVPTEALHRFLDYSTKDKKWWEIAEKDLQKRLAAAKRMKQTRDEEIARISEELQYRQDHPEAER